MKLKSYLAGFLFLFVACAQVHGQSYGLGFAGHNVVQDKRTSLDLSQEPICFDQSFELSFDLSFMEGYTDYFGYVFRIIDQENRNIDLVYDMRFLENKHFKLIIGDKVSDITFDIAINELYRNWHKIRIRFDQDGQKLQLSTGGKTYTQILKLKNDCYKVLFGANGFKDFKVKDVPPMKIRDVKILKGNKLNFHWPLNERTGLYGAEKIQSRDAIVSNPIWIKKMHHDWSLVKNLVVEGAASVAFNAEKEALYLVSEDSLAIYSVGTQQLSYLAYQSGKQSLLSGNQSLYDTNTGKLFNFYMDQQLVAGFDFKSRSWDRKYVSPAVITNFWHPNKFYSAIDSSFYMIGGYGQYQYKNEVTRYHFPDNTWKVIPTSGEYMPRYLAALGAVKNGAYLLGGYGSTTGEQILNPKNTYELSFYDAKLRQFKKLFELEPKAEDFAFANSMVINPDSDSYYALTFSNHRYNSTLQLIAGSLKSPAYKYVGNTIPYAFHDIHSFADLYYCPRSKKFVAVTLFHDEQHKRTAVKIYTLSGPPEEFSDATQKILSPAAITYIVVFGLAALLLVALMYIQKKRSKSQVALVVEKMEEHIGRQVQPGIKNAIMLFGDLQVFDKEGNDITRNLSPLIRELFLVVLLYTIKWERGISTEKLTEILWFDKSVDSARNNRSVNIAKLKVILEKMDLCQISKETGYWKIIFDEHAVKIDYSEYLRIVNDKGRIDRRKVDDLTALVHRGSFLSNVEYEWLDAFKSEISNEIIDTYLHYAATIRIEEDAELLVKLANYVFYFDPVNEEATVVQCRALVHLGKHSLAKAKFETFSKEYKVIYGEEFGQRFNDILESKN
ncbi:MAG TPA: hypothetical protein VKB19_02065 [Pedobacter sp.]|nr:hypothetical protein [Pedobacter sp.]